MASRLRGNGVSALPVTLAISAFVLCATPAFSRAIEGPFTPGFIDLIARADSYCIGQAQSAEIIRRAFPDLRPELQRAEMLFAAGTGDVCQIAADTLVAAIGADNVQQLTEKARDKIATIVGTPDRAAAMAFIQEIEARSHWAIAPDDLTALLAVRYGSSPEREFTDGHISIYQGDGDPKLMGERLTLKTPLSWKELPGDRPHVVRKWVEQGGRGMNSIILIVKDFGQALGPKDLAEVASMDPATMAPDGATFIDGGNFVLEGLTGVRGRFRMSSQRVNLVMDQIVDQYMLPLPSGKVVLLGCYVGVEASEAHLLQRIFDRIAPLCGQVVNSLIVASLY